MVTIISMCMIMYPAKAVVDKMRSDNKNNRRNQ